MGSAAPPSAPQSAGVGSAVVICCLVNLNEAIAGNIIWPILPFLVSKHFQPTDVGFYVGILGSAYFFGQTLTVRTWGSLSDRYGRRPILLVGLAGSLLSFLWFGLARSYLEAVLSRLLCGIVNGNVAISKIYVGEVTNRHNQPQGFALLSLTWGLGTLVAPALGGFLADPAALYPGSALDTPLLREFPFLLPALISAGFSLLCLVFSVPLLKETGMWERRQRAAGAPQPMPSEQEGEQEGARAGDGEEELSSGSELGVEEREEGGGRGRCRKTRTSRRFCFPCQPAV